VQEKIYVQQKSLLFTFLFLVAFGVTGHAQISDTATTFSSIATFKFTAGDSTYIWSGDTRRNGEMGSWIEAIVNKRDTTQGLYVVTGAGGNGDKLKIVFLVVGKKVLQHSKTNKKATASIRVDTYLHANDWDNTDESDSTVQVFFTNLNDNMADGTFRCLVSSGSKKLSITRGEFHNLKIYKKLEDFQY
jgi:hypothetical protein